MATLMIRAVLLYIIIMSGFRLMGKRQIGQMQPFELVLTLIIADLATIPMSESSVPILHGIVPLLTLLVIHYLLTIICLKSNKFNKFLNGKPVIVIDSKGVDHRALKLLNMSIDDLLEGIRGNGFFSFQEVEYAIVETNGKITVLPRAEHKAVRIKDLDLEKEKSVLPITIISEGQLMKENVRKADISLEEIASVLKKAGIERIDECIVLTIDDNGVVYVQGTNSDFQTFKTKHKGKAKI